MRFGDRSFSACTPPLLNILPNDFQQAEMSYEHFQGQIKTFLFGDHGAV